MSQADEIQKTSDTQNGQKVHNVLHLKSSKGEGSKWSKVSLIKHKKSQEQDQHEQEDHGNHHNKKSVLAKVKEKAKKLKHSLSRKKHHDENDSRGTCVTRSTSVDKGEEDVEFYSARMSESKHTPDTKAPKDHPQETAPVSIHEKNSTTCNDNSTSLSNTTTPTVEVDPNVKILTPAAVLTESDDSKNQASTTHDVSNVNESPESTSKSPNLTVSTSEKKTEGEPQTCDKSVSVKEYLMQKFEPGEDERALSQVITQTISPRRDKVREAMSSFLKNEESSESTISPKSEVDNDTNLEDKAETDSINPSHGVESNDSNACENLNQTFKSTVATYQNQNTSLNSSRSPETESSTETDVTQVHVSSDDPLTTVNQTRVQDATNVNTTQVLASTNDHGVVKDENGGRIT